MSSEQIVSLIVKVFFIEVIYLDYIISRIVKYLICFLKFTLYSGNILVTINHDAIFEVADRTVSETSINPTYLELSIASSNLVGA